MLNAGSKKVWVTQKIVFYVICLSFSFFAYRLCLVALNDMGVNGIGIRYVYYLTLLLVLPALCQSVWFVWTREFVIEEDCLFGVDLWNVTRVRYSKHSIWLDNVRIDLVPNGKVLVQSLEEYYIQRMGVSLP